MESAKGSNLQYRVLGKSGIGAGPVIRFEPNYIDRAYIEVRKEVHEDAGDDYKYWDDEVNGNADTFERTYYESDGAGEYRVLTVFIDHEGFGHHQINCITMLEQGEEPESCESFLESVRFE
jgi:hypothetical protein